MTLLQVYGGDSDSLSILDDLDELWTGLHDQLKSTKKNKNSELSALLMEVLLSFASKPSVLYRKMSEQVFEAFAAEFSSDALTALVDILDKPETLAGQQDLFDADDDQVEDESDEESLDSDVEMIEGDDAQAILDLEPKVNGDASGSDSDSPSEGSDDGEESDEEVDENEQELQKLDKVLADTLGTGPVPDEDSDEEDPNKDMNDEQMEALEPALAKIFQERRKLSSKKKERKDAKETMINFKNRALDLITIFTKKEHANPLALIFITPLLRLIRSSSSTQLPQKAFTTLKTYFDSCKGKELPAPDDTNILWTVLEEVHEMAGEDTGKIYASACSRASLFVARALLALDKQHYDRIADSYSVLQKKWYKDRKSKVQPLFFTEWMSWSIGTRK